MSEKNTAAALRKSKKKDEEKLLIEKSLAGDELAFSKLYRRYQSQIYGFCVRLLRGKHDVDDAVQQVFFEAWRSMGRFEGRSLFSTWLTKIAIHICLGFHRKAGRLVFSSAEDTDIYEQQSDQLWGQRQKFPDEELVVTEKKEMINKLLSRMTEKKKIVFVMSDMQGMTAPEISQILKIPDATVRTRLFHARREFHSWIQRNKSYRETLVG